MSRVLTPAEYEGEWTVILSAEADAEHFGAALGRLRAHDAALRDNADYAKEGRLALLDLSASIDALTTLTRNLESLCPGLTPTQIQGLLHNEIRPVIWNARQRLRIRRRQRAKEVEPPEGTL
jgi:hypothetical protein